MNAQHPVTDLQQMLRQISGDFPQSPSVTPDGCFGEHTLEAVMVFQRDSGLPVTGVVDKGTWHALTQRCRKGQLPRSAGSGGQDSALTLLRLMFNALSQVICGFLPCEINSPAFEENLRVLRQVSTLSSPGASDEDCRRQLFRLFRLFVMRNLPK